MRKLLLVLMLIILSLSSVSAYSFTFSTNNYNIIEKPTFSWGRLGNMTFEWHGYMLNTSDYLYWAGILVSAIGDCSFNNEITLVDGNGRKFYVSYGEGPGANGTLYLQMFEPDLYSRHYNLSRGPYTFNITMKAKNCEVTAKDFIFVTSKLNPKDLPLMLIHPYRRLEKEMRAEELEFANKTYWREFELNFTYLYDGGYEDIVNGWKSDSCPIFSINNGKVCLAEKYCECYEENTTLSPGIYKINMKFQGGNLSLRVLKNTDENEIVFEKSVHVVHPLYLASLGGILSNVSFYGVEGSPSETFYTSEDKYGYFVFAVAIVIALILAVRWRR